MSVYDSYEKFIRRFVLVFAAILLFTGLDYLGHAYLEKNHSLEQVPQDYYKNKLIYGTIILFFASYLHKKGISIVTLITILALQLQYFKYYSATFNIYVLVLHYISLGLILYLFRKNGWIFDKTSKGAY